MNKTIFGKDGMSNSEKSSVSTSSSIPNPESQRSSTSTTTSDSQPEDEAVAPSEMVINESNGLGWLNEDLPDLSTVSHYHFDLELEFDIKRYLDILADEANGAVQSTTSRPASTPTVHKTGNASTVAPQASAWDT